MINTTIYKQTRDRVDDKHNNLQGNQVDDKHNNLQGNQGS